NKITWAFFWFTLLTQLASIPIVTLAYSLSQTLSLPSELVNWLVTDISLYMIAFPIFYMIIHSLPDTPIHTPKKRLNIPNILLLSVVCIGILYFFNIFGSMIASFLTSITGGEANPIENYIIGEPIYTVIFACMIPAIMEEIIFRKMIVSKLYPLGESFCIITSGIIFGLFHGNIVQIMYAIPIGCFLCYIYLKTNSLTNVVILHFLTNLTGSLVLPWLVTHYPTLGSWIMFSMIFVAIVYVVRLHKKITLDPLELPLSEKDKRELLFKSKGFIAYVVLITILAGIMLFLPSSI
ncbi:MAG: CPBP family intramembrane metalloprotease, partial [Erysipelotrichales bacterium]|nr:CPBP family intramembrane metalloprotease [Erysipelotrichales bacterium]